MKKIIITIPAYNEEETLGSVLEDIKKTMSAAKYHYTQLVVDDGSADNTANIAKKAGATVVSHKRNMGLAETFKTEMSACLKMGADIIVHTDADGQYPSHYIPEMIKKIEQGNDLVLGSRFGKGNYSGSFAKKWGNRAFARAISKITKVKFTDTTTGFRAFTKEVAELPLINSFTYTQEQLIRAAKAGMNIAEIPIDTKKTRESRLFSSPFNYAFKAWLNIFRIQRDFNPLKFFGAIGGIFILLGILLGTYIVASVLVTGFAGGTPRVVLSMLLIVTGFQILLFGFLADMVKK